MNKFNQLKNGLAMKKWKEIIRDALNYETGTGKLLILLLLADIVFMLIHIILYKIMHLGHDPLLSIVEDKGYSEVFQYIKEFWIAMILLILALKKKHLIYLSWSLLFLYLLLDDSAQIHENVGSYLVTEFDIQPLFGLRAQDFGELGVSLFFAGILFSFIAISFYFSNKFAKKISIHLFLMVMVLAFFGVVLDMVHMFFNQEMWSNAIFELLEDGGEMIIMSIIVWYVFKIKPSAI